MGDVAIIAVLFLVAVIILVAEVFIPSHGILSIAGVAFLVVAVVKTFAYSERVGFLALFGSVVLVPVVIVVATKVWPHTMIGRAIAPENPVVSARDIGVDLETMDRLIGRVGRAVSPLRPVGTCEFDGRRFQCTVEMGMIAAGAEVKAIGIQGSGLIVAAVRDASAA
jgi:membrane-bound ClpP family serine protease